MPSLGSSNSATNKDMMSNILKNGDTIFWLSRKHCGTSILKVLHGNTKSPTCCMYSWRYNILYLTILYNIRNVFVFVCIAFKNAGDWLTCQKSAQYLQGYRKKVWKTVPLMKFTKSKALIPRKIYEVQRNSNSMCKSWWLTYMPKSSSISASI